MDFGPVFALLTAALGLDAQELLFVVPLVQGFGLVEPFVTLEANELGAGDLGDRLGELCFAGSSGPSTRTGLPSFSARNATLAMPSSAR